MVQLCLHILKVLEHFGSSAESDGVPQFGRLNRRMNKIALKQQQEAAEAQAEALKAEQAALVAAAELQAAAEAAALAEAAVKEKKAKPITKKK